MPDKATRRADPDPKPAKTITPRKERMLEKSLMKHAKYDICKRS
jgi:hypothetical protein